MAWLLLGLGGAAVASWIGSEISDGYTRITKPAYDYFNERAREKEICEREAERQIAIHKSKDRDKKTYEKITQFVDTDKYQIKMTNNTEDPCLIIFVNHDRATDTDQAIKWAKKEIGAGILERSNTKIDTLAPNAKTILTKWEIKEYTIVLSVNNNFVTLNQNDFSSKKIFVKEKFGLEEIQADVRCKGWI
jgi:hypothetical protein